ncbi:MAG: hypothetical protein R3B90_00645 [Planctomycetaceae bacterium]
MTIRTQLLSLSLAVMVLFAGLARSAVAGPPTAGETQKPDVAELVRQLDAEGYVARRDARAALVATGAPAIEPVREAAIDAEGQLAGECVRVLSELSRSDDAAIAAQAKAALNEVAERGKEEVAQLAKNASRATEPVPAAPAGNQINVRIQINGQQWQPGQGQIFQNGRREVEVQEGDAKIKITEMRGGPITITTTKLVDGKEVTTEVTAGNPAELHRKDPEAFELYRKHLLLPQAGPVQIQIGGQVPGNLPNLPIGNVPLGNMRFENVAVSNVNGNRTIDANTNGLAVHIEDKEGRDIRMEIIEGDGDARKTRSFEADDLDDLRTQDAEAAKLYEKYAAPRPVPPFGQRRLPPGF